MVNPMLDRIYLDYAAATPLDPRVWTAMEPFFATHFANPSSLHQEGVFARRAVEEARAKVAALIKAQPDEIIFTSGPTESINLAIQGALAAAGKRGTILLSETEHAAGLAVPDDTVVNKVPVDDTGLLNEDIYAQFLAESPGIASFASTTSPSRPKRRMFFSIRMPPKQSAFSMFRLSALRWIS